MSIINPLHAHKHDSLFATHPATENRIAALRAMASGGSSRAKPMQQAAQKPTTRSRIPKTGRGSRKTPWG